MAALPSSNSVPNQSLAELLEQVTELLQLGNFSDLNDIILKLGDSQLELNELIPLLKLLNELGPAALPFQSVKRSARESRQDLLLTQLDDFHIVGQLARGGMGIVYEAVQVSRGRRVALKVLPFVPLLDHRQAARFKREAQVAATLDHPHIVPVYAVGSVGHLQYYAMQLVPGQSLAELIATLRSQADKVMAKSVVLGCTRSSPEEAGRMHNSSSVSENAASVQMGLPRLTKRLGVGKSQRYNEVARLGIQAAQALEYAHNLDVIHRDVKPSNLLVSDEGHLWLADFGLARLGDGSELTKKGDLIGTMRYMSPEQARGHSACVDRRADIYSLGVTLYELLALQPAFGNIRPCTLSPDVACQEPRPLRRIDSAVPRDLEIIVGKAMAEDKKERYNSAGDMADDLRRFLNHRPILAKPSNACDHICKMVRRHAALSFLLCIVAVILFTAFSVGARIIQGERNAAETLAERERQASAAAQHHEREALQAKSRAITNLQHAHAAVDRLFESAEDELSGVPNSDRFRHDLLEDALVFYQALLQETPEDDSLRYDLAVALNRVADINHRLGSGTHAESASLRAFNYFQQLAKKYPDSPQYQFELAQIIGDRSEICLARTGRRDHAEAFARQRIRLLSGLLGRYPNRSQYQAELALAWSSSGRLLSEMGSYEEALESLDQAMMIWEKIIPNSNTADYSSGLAGTHQRLASVYMSTNQLEEAEQHLTRARHYLLGDPRPTSQLLLAEVERNQAQLLVSAGDLRRAITRLVRAIEICKQLTNASPDPVEYRHLTAECQWDLFQVYALLGDLKAAEEKLHDSTQQLNRISGLRRGSFDYQLDLARNHLSYGLFLHENQSLADAKKRFKLAAQLLEASVEQFSDSSDPHANLSWLLATCPDDSFRDANKAVQLAKRAVEIEPNRASHWLTLGAALYRAGEWTQCIAASDQARRLYGDDDPMSSFYAAMAHHQLGDIDSAQHSFQLGNDRLQKTSWQTAADVSLQLEAEQLLFGNLSR